MEPQIELVNVEAADAAVLRERIAARGLPGSIMPLFARLQQMMHAGTVPAGLRHVWVYRHLEGGEVDAEVGVLSSAAIEGLAATRTPAGRAVHAAHIGDFSKLMALNAALQAFCREHGHEQAGITWEVYSELDQPPDRRRCDMYLLLK